jgi:DNA recombination protein RmuC
MDFIYLILGIAIGFALAWFIKKNQPSLIQNTDESKGLKDFLTSENLTLKTEIESKQDKIISITKELITAKVLADKLEEKLSEQKADLINLREQFTKEFENLANKIFEEKSRKFTDQNKTNLDDILKPFNEKIKDFEKKVGEVYDIEMRDKISLREEVKKLYELNSKISDEANNLTKALKGDNKTQGNWGELILEKVLERSGLTKDREYKTQVVTKNVDGEIIKPDVVVFLPDSKHLVIDAKVSLIAYENFINTDEKTLQEKFLKEHIASVKSHVKLLSDKNYYSSTDFSTPDFVLLFMPIESAFSAAVQNDMEMFNYAWERRIVIVSPTTLLATLRTVSSLWKIESQNRYAIEIANQAGALYDKFEGFIKDLLDMGKKMDDSKKSYEEAMKKLSTGKGNLVNRIENLKTLGAKATKNLPQALIERADENIID